MPGKAAKVTITERQQAILKQMCVSTVIASRLKQRALIILLAFSGRRNEDIAEVVGLARSHVGTWRRRWAKSWDKLVRIECADSGAALRRAIEQALSDEPRSGCSGTFSPEQVTQILAVACEPPEKSGRPITHWTIRELRDEVVKRGIVESISPAQVGRYLREAKLQPHRSRYWLNAREKDPVVFQQLVEDVCQTYLRAPGLYEQHNTHTVCVDEMTGIQALERIAATLPIRPGQIECREFEYERHGTLTLIGNFHVVTGELIQPTIQATRTEADFVQHIDQTVSSDTNASWVFVVDNLNIHCSESLVIWVAKTCGLEEELGKKRCPRHPEIPRDSSRIPHRRQPSNSLCVSAKAHVVAQPNRDRIRGHYEKGRSTRQLQLD